MRRTLSFLAGILLAIALSQFPEYAQQYTQRLAGAVDELHRLTTDFDVAAARGGLTRSEALARYETNSDTFISGRGTSMRATFVRYDQLSGMLTDIRGAGPFGRLRLLPEFLDTDIGARTLADFKPAVPVTPEGFVWAGAGLVAGYLIVGALVEVLALPFKRRRARRRPYRQRI